MQASLAIIGAILGFLGRWSTGRSAFVTGGILLLANWRWTIFAIMPTNNLLAATPLEGAGPDSRKLIVKWNILHSVRPVLGICATVAFLIALSSE